MCTNYWLTACSSLPRKSVVRLTDRPAMTIAVDLGRKATKQTKGYEMSASHFQSRSSLYIRGLIPPNSTGLAEAVPIDLTLDI